jgi:2,3-dihydroxy-2,3-dihydro-p-cumate dehydrogenase
MCDRFKDRVAIVTGAAQGIGKVIAQRLAREGARVVVADVQDAKAREVARGLPGAIAFAGDVAEEVTASELAAVAVEAFGRIDVLVNNAGGGGLAPFLEHTNESLHALIQRNLMTTIRCSTAVFPRMIEQRYGRIVNIGADSVRNGLYFHAMYNAAKGGVNGLTTGLAREGAMYGITVNCVAPTGVTTERTPELFGKRPEAERWRPGGDPPAMSQLLDAVISMIPMRRLGTMEEVAATVAFVASEEASFLTGQVISLNGGANML